MAYTVVVAGSTVRTKLCAETLARDPRFSIVGIITPEPKLIGRKQILTKNPLHLFAEANAIPTVLVEKKLHQEAQEQIMSSSFAHPDLLLVVDFGYIVPRWLLDLPKIAPVNIHPSDLPKYRGSSPGQFVLICGERYSAVSIMVMDEQLDHGPIITKIPFGISSNWTSSGYYGHAFSLVCEKLGDILEDFCEKPGTVTPQPDESPTPTARMLTKDDGFVRWDIIQKLLDGKSGASLPFLDALKIPTTPHSLVNLWRGLSPWPGIWTLRVVKGQEKRMKLLEIEEQNGKLSIVTVQYEGKTAKPYALTS